jgi:Recombinase
MSIVHKKVWKKLLGGFNYSDLFLYDRGMADDAPHLRRPAVSAGMAASRARGVRLGRPPAPPPPSARRAAELRDAGRSLAEIAETLVAEQVPTPSGKGTWQKSSVQYVLARWDQAQADEGGGTHPES